MRDEARGSDNALAWREDVARDLRFGFRVLRRNPAFTVVAVLTLALGVGANAAIFHLIDVVSLRTLPIADPETLVDVSAEGTSGFGFSLGANGQVTYPLWEQIRTEQRAFSGMLAWADTGLPFGQGSDARRVEGLWVSGEFFQVLGIRAARGRLFAEADDLPGCGEDVAVVSHGFWQAELGGDESVVGRTLVVFERPFTVIGVTGREFTGIEVGRRFDIALPLCAAVSGPDAGLYARRDVWWLRVMGRLDSAWTVTSADEHLRALSPAMLDATLPEGYGTELLEGYRSFRFGAKPAGRGVSRLRATHSTSLTLLLGLTGIVLLITSANLGTLMLARAGTREREIAMRAALGASRRRIVSQLVTESLLVAAAGAAIAVPVALASANALVTFLDTPANPISLAVGPGWRLIAFVAFVAVGATMLFGLLPALRVSTTDPLAATREVTRGLAGDPQRGRLRRGLVTAQVALSLILIVAAVSFVRSVRNLSEVELGFDPGPVAVAYFYDPAFAETAIERRTALQEELAAAIRRTLGVVAAAASTHVPLSGDTFSHFFDIPGAGDADTKVSRFAYVAPGYFDTLDIPLITGRDFDERDQVSSPRVLVVNESFVRHHLGLEPPVGARVHTIAETGYPESTYEIVGVVGNTKYARLRDETCLCDAGEEPMPPVAYAPIAQHSILVGWAPVIVRAANRPLPATMRAIEESVRALNPQLGVQTIEMAPWIAASLATERTLAWLAGAFAVLATLLVVVGIYGVIAYFVVSRRIEIGVRLALGCTRKDVVALVLRDSSWLLSVGVIAGLPMAVMAMRGAGTLLFGISPTDPSTLAGAVLLLAAAGGLAGGVPAWRASMLHPMVAIRDEPESMWETARVHVRDTVRGLAAHEKKSEPLSDLAVEFADLVRRAASFPEAVDVALSALGERIGARSIVLLEPTPNGEFRGANSRIPADGILVSRLRCYRNPLPLTEGDVNAWRRWAGSVRPARLPEVETIERIGARIAVALRIKSRIIGVLLVAPEEGRDTFTPADVRLLGGAADVFALLIENARLGARAVEEEKLRHDVTLAAEVQRRLLPPSPPMCEAATFAAATMPARTVGGDCYDFLDLDRERIGVAVADIAGKGIAAALIASTVHALLRVMASDGHLPVGELAARMNAFLYQSTDSNRYATFFYAELDLPAKRLRYVNAGHNPPYLVRRTDAGVEITELTVGGTVLGLFPGMQYEDGEVVLCPGDLLVAFTDGVTEALNAAGEEFGEERLQDFARSSVGASAEDVSSSLAARVREWMTGAEQHDDVTFVVVSMGGKSPEPS